LPGVTAAVDANDDRLLSRPKNDPKTSRTSDIWRTTSAPLRRTCSECYSHLPDYYGDTRSRRDCTSVLVHWRLHYRHTNRQPGSYGYLGDAARYFRNSPANVAVRRAIRKEAVETLERLHTSGLYDRIIIVAHSLGCVVSYDMLRAYFSRVSREFDRRAGDEGRAEPSRGKIRRALSRLAPV
jgi:hypothetical protein